MNAKYRWNYRLVKECLLYTGSTMKVLIIKRLFYKVLTVIRPVLENGFAMNGVRYIACLQCSGLNVWWKFTFDYTVFKNICTKSSNSVGNTLNEYIEIKGIIFSENLRQWSRLEIRLKAFRRSHCTKDEVFH